MLNLQEIINRYKDKIDRSSVMGFLTWGGKPYYRINSDKPISLNSTFEGFILNKEGFAEEYEILENEESLLYFSDKELTNQISWEEFYNLFGDNDEIYSNQVISNPNRTKYTRELSLSEYYPHPWFPEKEIISFKCIRIVPFWELNKEYELDEEGLITSEDEETKMWEYECLQYPEFFEPIYK